MTEKVAAPLRSEERFSILLLCAQAATGGAQRVMLLQADWFHKRGYPVTAAFLYDKENLIPTWRSQYKFPIYDLGFARPTASLLLQGIYFVRGLVRLFRLMLAGRFTAVETFALHANLVGLPMAWLAGIPNRIASHRGKIEAVSPVLEGINAAIVNSWLAKCLVVVSDRAREDAIAEGVRPGRTVKIANGVTRPHVRAEDSGRLRNELKLSVDDPVLLSVGRLRHQKGHEVLLRALPDVLREFSRAQLLIAGDGVLRQDLEAQAAAAGVSSNVKFLGMRKDVPVLLSLADVFVFPSRFEGMPNAVLEAMSMGLPVIATSVQGVDELIQDEGNGLLVAMDDSVALSQAILCLLRDPDTRQRLGDAARARIESDYTVERMCRQYEQLLRGNWPNRAAGRVEEA
jgi:glycosyltransferase involved in cell wall biosynthesis